MVGDLLFLVLLAIQQQQQHVAAYRQAPVAFVPRSRLHYNDIATTRSPILSLRGGATAGVEEEEEEEGDDDDGQILDFDEDDEDGDIKVTSAVEDEDDEAEKIPKKATKEKVQAEPAAAVSKKKEDAFDAKMAKSALQATQKSKAKQTANVKKVMSAELKAAPSKKRASSSSHNLLKLLHVPYIVRATINPITLFRMTRAYFASLFNLNYLKEVRNMGCCNIVSLGFTNESGLLQNLSPILKGTNTNAKVSHGGESQENAFQQYRKRQAEL
jgi:hypothetical protein